MVAPAAPYISREDVAAALASLVHAPRRMESTGLLHLLLVDLRVTAPDRPANNDPRGFALRDLLVDEITAALTEARRTFGLEAPDERALLAESLAALAGDGAVGAHELLAWSILYYRYVRPDLALSVEALSAYIGVTTRTITRYNDEGIDLLTQRLIRSEQAARRLHLERRLYAALPYSVPVRLVGRDGLLRQTEAALPTLSPRHILITGTTGIGKTTFVQELLRRQVAAGNLDHLIWLNQPGSVAFIRQQLTETFLREDGQVTLRDYLLLYRVAVVLDEIESAAADRALFVDLLRDLGAALVCLISHTNVALDGIEAHLTMPEIGRGDAEQVIEGALRLHPALHSDERRTIAHELVEHVGGNPLALRLAAALWEQSDDWQTLERDVHEHLFERTLAVLDADERRAWGALALFPRPAHPDELTEWWGLRVETLVSLVRLALVERGEDEAYALVGGARDYIRRQYESNAEVRALFHNLIASVADDTTALDVAEQMLVTGLPELDPQARTGWIRCFWGDGLRRGHWARWRSIFETQLQRNELDEPDLRIAYGICLRRLADWEGARQVFRSTAADCGRAGEFAEQARALVEWGILAKNQGEYETALDLIGQARRYAERVRDDDLLRSLAIQEAQILIQQGRAGEVETLLAAVPETAQVLALQCEALLALGNHDACRSLAARALRLVADDPATEASLYTIVGRSFEHQSDHDRAHAYLTDAVTLLERGDDAFSLARAQTNLAAILIPMRRYPDAGVLLDRAEDVQARLGDRVGLGATRHNRHILGGHIAR